ncbi:MAG TPA: gliding motility-associated C-terminal domain-containing protein, partial [Saprospiraceae bacterium]|nr:gliding motility-associated C-terminal domain-containing protein [Saprospiraceae bacterium]
TLVCEGITFQLYADADAGTSIEWQDGSNFPVYTVTSPGMYVLVESNQCGTVADTVLIMYESAPGEFDLGPDTLLCPNEFILLLAPVTQDLVTWQDGSHDMTMVANHEQTYSLMISNQCGSMKDEIDVSFDERVPAINIDDQVSWCKDDIITLDATQVFEASYAWSTGSHFPSIQINAPGSYSIIVTTDCQAIEKVVNVVQDESCNLDIYIPSVFSPNGDQVNDVFEVQTGQNLDVVSMSCAIFDRWGNNVFNSREINFAWDGKYKGSYLQPGVYVYVVSVGYRVQGEIRSSEFEGGLTLIR